MEKKIKYVMWTGFTGSGSSAVGDYLKEFAKTFECGKEIRFIKDPYGLIDLEYHLVEQWEFINSIAAVHDFLNQSKIWGHYGDNPFSRPGLSYKKKINKDYYKLTKKFIDELTVYTFRRDFYHTKFKKNYFMYVTDRIRNYIERKTKGKLKISNRHIKINNFCTPTKEEFETAAKRYINSLFAIHANNGETTILLDLPISPSNTQSMHSFFDNAKMIIVERDPRDMYVEEFEWGLRYGKKLGEKEDGKEYVLKRQAMRRTMDINDKDILYIHFEDLVLKYEETTKIIREFVGFEEKDHIFPFKYFKPEQSKKNIGLWKKYYNKYKDAIDIIHEDLADICYEG